jgi:hypothetical protein
VDPRDGLDLMAKKEILPCRESKPDRPVRSIVSVSQLLNDVAECNSFGTSCCLHLQGGSTSFLTMDCSRGSDFQTIRYSTHRSQDSSVVQRRTTGCMIGSSSPGRGWEFFASPPRSDRLWIPPSLLSSGYQIFRSG